MEQAASRIRFKVVGKREALFPDPEKKGAELRAWEIELQPEMSNPDAGIIFPAAPNGGPQVLGVVTTNGDVAASYKVGDHAPVSLEWPVAVLQPRRALDLLKGN